MSWNTQYDQAESINECINTMEVGQADAIDLSPVTEDEP